MANYPSWLMGEEKVDLAVPPQQGAEVEGRLKELMDSGLSSEHALGLTGRETGTLAATGQKNLPGWLTGAEEPEEGFKTGFNVAGTDVLDIMRAVPQGVLSGAETLTRAADLPFVLSGKSKLGGPISTLEQAAKSIGPAKPNDITKGVSQAVQSLTAGAPTTAAGMFVGGPVGATAGFIGGKGAVYGLAEVQQFLTQLKEVSILNGATEQDLAEIQSNNLWRAVFSGGLEMTGEVLSDFVSGRVLGLLGSKTLSPGVKQGVIKWLKDFAPKALKVGVSEQVGEQATAAGQAPLYTGAGMPQEYNPWDVAGPTAVSSFLFAIIGKFGGDYVQRNREAVIKDAIKMTGQPADIVKKEVTRAEKLGASYTPDANADAITSLKAAIEPKKPMSKEEKLEWKATYENLKSLGTKKPPAPVAKPVSEAAFGAEMAKMGGEEGAETVRGYPGQLPEGREVGGVREGARREDLQQQTPREQKLAKVKQQAQGQEGVVKRQRPSTFEPTDNYFNRPELKSNTRYAWRAMGEKEFDKLMAGEKEYLGDKAASKGNFLAAAPESAGQYGGKGRYLVEFGGVKIAGDEGLVPGSKATKDNVTKVWKHDGEKWVQQARLDAFSGIVITGEAAGAKQGRISAVEGLGEERKEGAKPAVPIPPTPPVQQAGEAPSPQLEIVKQTEEEDHTFYTMKVNDAAGKYLMTIDFGYYPESKTINIDLIQSEEGKGSLGASTVLSIKNELLKKFDVENIKGFRVTGKETGRKVDIGVTPSTPITKIAPEDRATFFIDKKLSIVQAADKLIRGNNLSRKSVMKKMQALVDSGKATPDAIAEAVVNQMDNAALEVAKELPEDKQRDKVIELKELQAKIAKEINERLGIAPVEAREGQIVEPQIEQAAVLSPIDIIKTIKKDKEGKKLYKDIRDRLAEGDSVKKVAADYLKNFAATPEETAKIIEFIGIESGVMKPSDILFARQIEEELDQGKLYDKLVDEGKTDEEIELILQNKFGASTGTGPQGLTDSGHQTLAAVENAPKVEAVAEKPKTKREERLEKIKKKRAPTKKELEAERLAMQPIEEHPLFLTEEQALRQYEQYAPITTPDADPEVALKTFQAVINREYHAGEDIGVYIDQLSRYVDKVQADEDIPPLNKQETLKGVANLVDLIKKIVERAIKPLQNQGGFLDLTGIAQRLRDKQHRTSRTIQLEESIPISTEGSVQGTGETRTADITIRGRKPDPDLLTTMFMAPYNVAKKYSKAAADVIARIIHAKDLERYNAAQAMLEFKEIINDLSESEQRDLTSMMRSIEDGNIPGNINAKLREKADRLKEFFDSYRERMKSYRRFMLFDSMSSVEQDIMADIQAGKDAAESTKERNKFARDANKQAKAAGSDSRLPTTTYKTILSYREELAKIDKWGFEDYITHAMKGNIAITDEKGHIVSVAQTTQQAIDRATDAIKKDPTIKSLYIDYDHWFSREPSVKVSKKQYGYLKGNIIKAINKEVKEIEDGVRIATVSLGKVVAIKPGFVFSAFTQPREDILPGEENVFNILPTYIYQMEKKMALDPVIQYYGRVAGELKGQPNLKRMVEKDLDAAKGTYWLEDKIVDSVFQRLGISEIPFKASNIVAKATAIEANLKFGYRPVAALINRMSGLGHTWVKTGIPYIIKAHWFLKTPEGKLFMQNHAADLGTALVEEAGGKIKLKMSPALPTYMFQAAEKPNREESYVASYMWAKDKLGYGAEEAREFARRSVWLQQFNYNIAAMPEAFRSPAGRIAFQFKTYLVNELHFIASLKGPQEWAKYLTMQFVLGGPKGFLLTLRSFPLIGALAGAVQMIRGGGDWFDDLEKFANTYIPKLYRGGFGFFGIDASMPASLGFPEDFSDLAGVIVSDLVKIYRDVFEPMQKGEKYIKWPLLEAAKGAIPIMKYWTDLWLAFGKLPGIPGREGEVWDRKGAKIENLNGMDFVKMLGGAMPLSHSIHQTSNRIETKLQQNEAAQAASIVEHIVKSRKKLDGDVISEKLANQLGDLGMSVETILSAIERASIDPEMRNVLRARMPSKLRALEERGEVNRALKEAGLEEYQFD